MSATTVFKRRSQLTQMRLNPFRTCTVGRTFAMRVEHTYSGVHTSTNSALVNYSNFHNIPAKLTRLPVVLSNTRRIRLT
jgi:hypothetical protein